MEDRVMKKRGKLEEEQRAGRKDHKNKRKGTKERRPEKETESMYNTPIDK